MASNFFYPPTKNAIQKTLAVQLEASATTGDAITFADVDGIPNKPGILAIDVVDSTGTSTPSAREYISYSGTSGNTVIIATRNVDGSSSAMRHLVGAIVDFIPDVVLTQRIIDQFLVEHGVDGTHDSTFLKTSGAQTVSGAKTFSTAPLFTFGSEAAGDLFYGAADGTITRLAIGSSNQVLKVSGGVPAWGAASTTLSSGYTALSSNFTSTANTNEQTVSGLTTTVTDLGVNMRVQAIATVDLSGVPAGNTTVTLKINGTSVCQFYQGAARTGEQSVSLSGQANHTTGSDVSVTVTVQNDASNSITVLGTSARSTVSVLVWAA